MELKHRIVIILSILLAYYTLFLDFKLPDKTKFQKAMDILIAIIITLIIVGYIILQRKVV